MTSRMIDLKTCPTCESRRIRMVRRTVTRKSRGKTYTVPHLTFHECTACGEQVYGPEAMAKIKAHRRTRGQAVA